MDDVDEVVQGQPQRFTGLGNEPPKIKFQLPIALAGSHQAEGKC